MHLPASRPLLTVLAIACALSYSSWIVLPNLDPQLSIRDAFVSEYAVPGRPGSAFMRTWDAIAGLLMIALGLLVGRGRPRWERLLITVGLVTAGAATIADSILPMECAPSFDPACAADELAGRVGLAHKAHLYTSSVAGFAICAAALGSMLGWPGRRLLRALAVGVIVMLTLTGINGIVGDPIVQGIGQRISLVVTVVWFVALAAAPRTAAAEAVGTEASGPEAVGAREARRSDASAAEAVGAREARRSDASGEDASGGEAVGADVRR